MSFAEGESSIASKSQAPGVYAGVHLAGPNARKSAVVLLESFEDHVCFLSLYEKIGSLGTLFSDERILNILKDQAQLKGTMVDCPVTEPPCVECERPVCPGVLRCDDVTVAMMLAIEQQRGRKGAHKLRPLNPQNQRLWDVMYARGGSFGNLEPSYSANLAPLVVRARTLQRRLRAVYPKLILRETNIPILVSQLGTLLDGDDWGLQYRSFERGRKIRSKILTSLATGAIPQLTIKFNDPRDEKLILNSVEAFHAFMTACMAAWRQRGYALPPTPFFEEHPGWVHLIQTERIIR